MVPTMTKKKPLDKERLPAHHSQANLESKLDNATPDSNSEPKRTPKDPKLPKRPHNAFFYFSQERRPAMQKEFPNLTKKEIAAVLTQKWNELPVSEKAVYIHLQNERKKQYQEIMQQYNENLPSEPLM